MVIGVGKRSFAAVKTLPDEGAGWTVHYALFGRKGFTPAAKAEMGKNNGFLVDLHALDRLLGHD